MPTSDSRSQSGEGRTCVAFTQAREAQKPRVLSSAPLNYNNSHCSLMDNAIKLSGSKHFIELNSQVQKPSITEIHVKTVI